MSALRELMQPSRLTEVVDIGANPLVDTPPYLPMLRDGLCRVTGFEPQPDALARLERAAGPHERYLPAAIGDGERHTLHVCAESGFTSLFEPDAAQLALLTDFPRLAEVVDRVDVDTTRLDDITEIVATIGNKLDVMMLPKVEGAWDIHYLDQLLAQLEAKHAVKKPILIHAILETAQGVNNVEQIATASPRMHGMSLGPADLAASRGMKTTRVGGGHPDYFVLADGKNLADKTGETRTRYQQDLWHYTTAKMVDACAAAGIKPFYGPFGDFSDPEGCESQFRNSFLMGCAGAWSLHPTQIAIAKRVFSPDPAEVAMAKKIIDAMPDGTGAVMIDGKMQDDATWKQAKVVFDLAKLVAAKDPELAVRYGL